MTRSQLQEMIRPVLGDLEEFDRRLDKYLKADSRLITAVVKHIMASRGKRLRPSMLFLSARGGNCWSLEVIDAALAVELIHTATLLHDDVVDESDTRRGQESVNFRWNNLVSVLMGDFLFSRAFQIMVRTGSPELIGAISKATERVSFGELRQIEEADNFELNEKEYIKIISDKTASLFAVSCEAGPILKKSPEMERNHLRDFGENIGIAFQIADDLLDYVGDPDKTGKARCADLLQGKITLPLIHALARSSEKVRTEISGLLNNGIDEQGVDRVFQFINDQGGIDYAYDVARSYSEKAAGVFEILDDNEYSRRLKQLVDFTVTRDN